ncbi:ATP-binding protein, partial [Turicimonas muris]
LQRIQVSMSSRKSAGLGIGLSIVRSIIQNHGGKFSIKRTELGSGITCEITLPLFKAEHSQEIKPDRTIEAHTK